MSRQNATTSLYMGDAISKLYNDICQGLVNIERVEYLDFDRITKYSYERDTKRHWYYFWVKQFNGSYEEYLKTKVHPKENQLKYSRAYKRMQKLHDIVGDAIALTVDGNKSQINLSLSDHSFIEVCKEQSDWSGTYHNASLD